MVVDRMVVGDCGFGLPAMLRGLLHQRFRRSENVVRLEDSRVVRCVAVEVLVQLDHSVRELIQQRGIDYSLEFAELGVLERWFLVIDIRADRAAVDIPVRDVAPHGETARLYIDHPWNIVCLPQVVVCR
ncbi:hypothetical protein [Nocardia abscessus]|uniref:hypothetical protein n=1 Tax=Nocardia abscessus TaxID=120957 RepID=UPI0024560884|nr:hypothetical protein [Nocardia abscessus]